MPTTMTPWLHFAGGDNLYFKSWRPASSGAIAGACIVLVCLAILERFVAAARSAMEARWRHSTLALTAASKRGCTSNDNVSQHHDRGEDAIKLRPQNSRRLIAPFILAHDVQRGLIHAIQAFLRYALMLAVMTFQAAYLMSIVLGLGVGEVLFKRMESVIPQA